MRNTRCHMSDGGTERVVNDKSDSALANHRTALSEVTTRPAATVKGQSSISEQLSKTHSSVSTATEQRQGLIVEDLQGSSRHEHMSASRHQHTSSSLTEELVDTRQSSKTLSSVSNDAPTALLSKSVSRSKSSESGPGSVQGDKAVSSVAGSIVVSKSVRSSSSSSQKSHQHSNNESVAMEISSDVKYVGVSIFS